MSYCLSLVSRSVEIFLSMTIVVVPYLVIPVDDDDIQQQSYYYSYFKLTLENKDNISLAQVISTNSTKELSLKESLTEEIIVITVS